MAIITFHANNKNLTVPTYGTDPDLIDHNAGSGLGFFGGGFGISVPVSDYQTTTFVTNAAGTASGIRCSNVKFDDSSISFGNSGCRIEAGDITGTSGIPNFKAPLNIRFEHDDPAGVRVQNCKLRIFDRNDITKHASGVTTQVYEVRHPNPIQDGVGNQRALKFRGNIGENKWTEFNSGPVDSPNDMIDLVMTPGPGPSGLNTSDDDTIAKTDGTYTNWIAQSGLECRATRHDWYLAISASPDSIGSKTDFGLYFTLEYL